MVAGLSGAGGAIPVPWLSEIVDVVLLKKTVNSYKSQLAIPEENSKEFHGLTPETKTRIKKYCITSASGTELGKEIGKLVAPYISNAEEFAGYIPVLGSAIAASVSFTTTYYFLHGCLDDLEETALKYLDEVKAKIGDDS